MKILVISDVVKWEGYEKIVDENQPDVVILAGDLTSDGFASFWSKREELIEQLPDYQEEKKKLEKELSKRLSEIRQEYKNPTTVTFTYKNIRRTVHWFLSPPSQNEIIKVEKEVLLDGLKEKYKPRIEKKFLELRKKTHVDLFYKFLEYAGKKSKVLVVKGDHDDDFEGDYIVEKINRIYGCKEISGKLVKIDGLHFLGLGFDETHYLRILKPLIEEFKGKVDVVITHCEQNKMPLVSLLKPRIIIRGHFGFGKYLVNDIPAVFTMGVKYTIIEFEKEKLPKIIQYLTDTKILEKVSCKPWFSQVSEYEKYPWLKPYPI
jgi:Icc-related predicted phosphoesterase